MQKDENKEVTNYTEPQTTDQGWLNPGLPGGEGRYESEIWVWKCQTNPAVLPAYSLLKQEQFQKIQLAQASFRENCIRASKHPRDLREDTVSGCQNLLKTQFEQQSLGSCTCPAPCRNWWPISQLIRPRHSHQNHMKPPRATAVNSMATWKVLETSCWGRCLSLPKNRSVLGEGMFTRISRRFRVFIEGWKRYNLSCWVLLAWHQHISAQSVQCQIERKTTTKCQGSQGGQGGLPETSLWSPRCRLLPEWVPCDSLSAM